FLLLYRARKTAGALRLPALQTFRRVGKCKRTHLLFTENTQKIKTKKAQHPLGFFVVLESGLNRRR
ncbi:hypothetical protein ACTLIY_002039, partial [Cronobacter turicensis]